ncbi:MAG: sensor histidine kinase, partial [Actinomycetes bacterium]
ALVRMAVHLSGSIPVLVSLTFVLIVVLAVGLILRVFAAVAGLLLGAPQSAGLAARVTELAESRAATVDAQAAELRRIERDLHDGAQARLAAVRMTLGLASQTLHSDVVRTAALLAEARDDAGRALSELRDLVRGIHPPVLADRGLAGGLAAAGLLCPVPVDLQVRLPGRPLAPVESAVYFAAAEALANIGRHSGGQGAWLRVDHVDGVLRVVVGDDGRGGADPRRGSGLRGIERRLAAFDGTLTVTSPAGGPTELTMEVPCQLNSVSSSPRTTSCSATD